MPLKQGASNETRQENIEEMIKAGHDPDQAVAASYRQQRQARAKKARAKDSVFHLSDACLVDSVHRSADGYLAAYANVARTGIQQYKGHELGLDDGDRDIRLYRPPEEVFDAKTVHSAAHRPVTLNHPPVMVNAKNWGKYGKGHSGDEIMRDGDHLRVPLVLMDQATIDAWEDGTKELSAGYSTEISWEPGETPEGEAYEGVQRNIRMNHFALVPMARGGSALRFGDAAMRHCADCGMDCATDAGVCDKCGGSNLTDAWSEAAREAAAEARKNIAKGLARVEAQREAAAAKFPVGSRVRANRQGASSHTVVGHSGNIVHTTGGDFHHTKIVAAKDGLVGGPFTKVCPYCATQMLRHANYCPNCQKAQPKGEPDVPQGVTNDTASSAGNASSSSKDSATLDSRGKAMVTLMVDGVPVEVADGASAGHLSKLEEELRRLRDAKRKSKDMGKGCDSDDDDDDDDDDDEVEKEKAREKKERGAKAKDALISAKDGEIAALKAQLADAFKASSEALQDAALREREAVRDAARKLLPQGFAFDGKSNADIRRAAVAAKLGDSTVKDMDDAAIGGAFKVLAAGSAKTGGVERLAAAFDGQQARHGPGYVSLEDGVSMRDQAYREYMDGLAGKKPLHARHG